MAKKKKEAPKVAVRERPRSTPARLAPAPKAGPKARHALRPDPVKLETTSKTVPSKPRPAPVPEPDWLRVLGHWVRKDELAKGCEWYDDGGNEGLKQRPISED